jgi:hypothetical protein
MPELIVCNSSEVSGYFHAYTKAQDVTVIVAGMALLCCAGQFRGVVQARSIYELIWNAD